MNKTEIFRGKRKGWLLLETVISMGVFAILLAAVVPAFGGFYKNLYYISGELQLQEECLFAEDYIADKIRHTLERTEFTERQRWDTFPVMAVNEYKKVAQYKLRVANERWMFYLYNGKSQPITGDQAEHTVYYVEEKEHYFTVEPAGLVKISFQMSERGAIGKRSRTVETAVLPLYDYFLVGAVYE